MTSTNITEYLKLPGTVLGFQNVTSNTHFFNVHHIQITINSTSVVTIEFSLKSDLFPTDTCARERDTWDKTDLTVEKGEESISPSASNLQLTGAGFVLRPWLTFCFLVHSL